PYCTVSCVHQVSMIDQFRDHPRESLSRFFPAQPDQTIPYAPPAIVRLLAWMFLPPEHNRTRKRWTDRFTRIALWCLRAKGAEPDRQGRTHSSVISTMSLNDAEVFKE